MCVYNRAIVARVKNGSEPMFFNEASEEYVVGGQDVLISEPFGLPLKSDIFIVHTREEQ